MHGELLSLVCPRESNQREGHPDIRVWPAARLPSLRCHSGGRRTRGVHAPLRLSPHPCGSSPCATPPLGLLTGTRAPRCLVVFLGAARIDRSHALRGNAAFGALRPLFVLRRRQLCDAERHWMGSHAERGNHQRGAWEPSTTLAFQAARNAPFRRPNGIIAEGVERQGCRERRDGPGMALRGVPLER